MYKINCPVERKGNSLHSEPEGTEMKRCTQDALLSAVRDFGP